jgi:hypothetical protein
VLERARPASVRVRRIVGAWSAIFALVRAPLRRHAAGVRLSLASFLAPLFLCCASCVFAGGNKASARDVEKPGDPRTPESKLVTVAFDGSGLSEPVYEAPADRAFVIQDLRMTIPCDVMAEVVGAPILLLSRWMCEQVGTAYAFRSVAGLKLPAAAKLRLQRDEKSASTEVIVFVAGELVRL